MRDAVMTKDEYQLIRENLERAEKVLYRSIENRSTPYEIAAAWSEFNRADETVDEPLRSAIPDERTATWIGSAPDWPAD